MAGAAVAAVVVFQRRRRAVSFVFFFQAEDGIRVIGVTGVQTCALPIFQRHAEPGKPRWIDQKRAVRLQVNPARLAGLGMSLDDVRRGIAATTSDNPKGSLDGPRQAFHIDANDQLYTADAYNEAVIAYRDGAPVTLRDVGNAIDS